MPSDNFVPQPAQLVSAAMLESMARIHPRARVVLASEASDDDTVIAREQDGDRVLVEPRVPGRTSERGVTRYPRVVQVGGRSVVMPAGTPVSRSTHRWGRADDADAAAGGPPAS